MIMYNKPHIFSLVLHGFKTWTPSPEVAHFLAVKSRDITHCISYETLGGMGRGVVASFFNSLRYARNFGN